MSATGQNQKSELPFSTSALRPKAAAGGSGSKVGYGPPGADVSACRDLVHPIGDGADRKRQVADLAVRLGLLLRGKNPSGNRSGVGQQAHLIPKLRQRNVMILRTCEKKHILPNAF